MYRILSPAQNSVIDRGRNMCDGCQYGTCICIFENQFVVVAAELIKKGVHVENRGKTSYIEHYMHFRVIDHYTLASVYCSSSLHFHT